MNIDKKTRKITKEDVKSRLNLGICPSCGDFRLVKVIKMTIVNDSSRDKKFLGSYWACGSEKSHQCYYLSEKECRESTTAEKILEIKESTKSTIFVRKKENFVKENKC